MLLGMTPYISFLSLVCYGDERKKFMIDLHVHTNYSSDGQHTPAEIFSFAKKSGITALAFCDHMDITAAAEGIGLAHSETIEFFTGVELSTIWDGRERHLLCFGFDPRSNVIREIVRKNCSRIWEHAHAVIDRFRDLGFTIGAEDVEGWGKSVPTGVTLLKALVKRNAQDPRLRRYTHGDRSDSPYLNFYQDFSHTGFGEAFAAGLPDLGEIIHALDRSGILVLAHPGKISRDELMKLKGFGLHGIEVYSSHHERDVIVYLAGLAKSLDLFASAGSDFHGEMIKPGISLGVMAGEPDKGLVEAIGFSMAAWQR